MLLAATSVAANDPVYALYSTTMPNQHATIVRVGPTRDATTVAAGITQATIAATGAKRSLVVIDPGVYTEQIQTVPRVDIAGATGNPDDVTIQHPCPTGFSPINTNGGPVWIGGVTSKLLTFPDRTGTGIYSIHHHGSSMTIFEKVVMDAEEGVGNIGMDGDAGSATWLIDCTIANRIGSDTLATNMHGAPSNTSPLTLVYDNLAAEGLGVNYNSLNSGQADEVYVQGGSVARVNVQGSATVAHIDPAVTDAVAATGATMYRDTMLPARPFRGS